jgi:ferredoxin
MWPCRRRRGEVAIVSAGQWRIAVDRDVCVGSGSCAGIAPGHFRLDRDRSCAIKEWVEPDELVLDAADSCPTEAISVYGASGDQLAPQP